MTLACPTANAVQEIERNLQDRIGPRRFQLWFRNSSSLHFDGRQVLVKVLNNFIGGWIENHFSDHLRAAAQETLQQEVQIAYQVTTDPGKSDEKNGSPEKKETFPHQNIIAPTKLRRKLRNSLDSFIVGTGNELAYSTINSVADKVISPFNPLFIHGGCGLGKTHLLQGLCNALSERHPNVGWHYISGEEFTNQFIVAIKSSSLDAFRRQYRNVDVLVIDDVHFLANKRATQEEFLHTFNAINAAGKQVVMASDAHPKSIDQLHNSLVDRFISGMVVQIDLPDQPTRAKIIETRAAQLGHDLPDPVIQLIAERINGNIRELEGAILKLFAYASLCNKPIGMDIAEKVVREYGRLDRVEIRISLIERKVAEYFNINVSDIRSAKRTRNFALARAIAMYLARKHTTLSFPEIGKYMGNKNHSTVILACQKIEQLLNLNQEVSWDTHTAKLTSVIADLEQLLK
ncbi:MAG: chromosomal replication initiator protein DnaA [Phycisphaerae bacterium]